MLVDSHCHLDFLQRQGRPLEEIVERAMQAGVGAMVTIGTKLSEAPMVIEIAERFANVYCTVGIHPHEAENEKADLNLLLELAEHPKVIGFGETGLDYFYEHSPRAEQQESFLIHIEAARRAGLPLVVHTRDAEQDTVEILHREYRKGAFTGLIHCFSSTQQLAEKAMEIGFYISLSGIVTFKKATELRAAAQQLPTDRILVETDAPYLAPVPHRGKMNEPAFVVHTAAALAELRGCAAADLARDSTENFFRLFTRARAAHPVALNS